MRFEALHLVRYGSLTDVRLDLSGTGVHLILGPNEAGKSTILEGLADLLFGFGHTTRQAHHHPTADLELAGHLRDGDTELVIVRRKRTPVLTTADGTPLEQQDLVPLLHGVHRDLFTTLFAIGPEELATGAEHLLATEGNVARAVFGASTGRAELQSFHGRFDAQAADLFAPRGKKRAVNAALTRLQDAKARIAQHSLIPAHWTATVEQAAALQRELDAKRAEEDELRRLDRTYRRLRSAMPNLAVWAGIKTQFGELAVAGPRLDPAERTLVEGAIERRSAAARDHDRVTADLARIDGDLTALAPDDAVLRFATQIEGMQSEVGAYSAGLIDRPEAKAKLNRSAREAETLAGRLGLQGPLPAAMAAVGPVLGARGEIEHLVHDGAERVRQRQRAAQAVTAATRQLDEAEQALAALPQPVDAAALEQVVRAGRALGSPDADREERRRTVERHHQEAAALIGRMGLDIDIPALDRLAVPGEPLVQCHQDRLAHLEAERRGIDQRLEEVSDARDGLRIERDRLVAGGPPATLDALEESRGTRNRLWHVIHDWFAGDSVTAAAAAEQAGRSRSEVAAEYEQSVAAADGLADDLRDHADLGGQLRAIDDQLAKLDTEEGRLRARRARLVEERNTAEAEWRTAWAPTGVVPTDPAGWRHDYEAARRSARSWQEGTAELTRIDAQAGDAAAALRAALDGVDRPAPVLAGGFAALLGWAEDTLADLTTAATRRTERHQTVDGLRIRLETAEMDLAGAVQEEQRWEQRWAALTSRVGLPAGIEPVGAQQWVATASELGAAAAACAEAGTDLERLDERIGNFEREMEALVAALDPSLTGGEPRSVVDQFAGRLLAARQTQTALALLSEERERLTAQLSTARSTMASANRELGEVRSRHGVDDELALLDAVRRSTILERLEAELAEQERVLLDQGDGDPIETLAAEAAGWTPESLDAELDRIGHGLADLAPVIEALTRQHSELVATLTQWRGSDDAATAAGEAEQIAGEIAELARQYCRNALAGALLWREIQRHRHQHEKPILASGGDFFSRLTAGQYVELLADEAVEGGRLLAHRNDGEYVGVRDLSDGTADELWCALRIAALECWPAERGPVPVVFDDTFSAFDEERVGVAFAILGELADRFQVIVLSHHDRHEELARAALPAGQLHVHRLNRFDPSRPKLTLRTMAVGDASEGPDAVAS